MELSLRTTARALRVAHERMAVRANNLANMNTEGFTPKRGLIEDGPKLTVQDAPELDVASDLVGMRLDLFYARVNSTAMRAQDELLGDLVDRLA